MRVRLAVVVEGELEGMRAEPNGVDLVLPLPVDPGPDQVLAEAAALEQDLLIAPERVESPGERPGLVLRPPDAHEVVEARGVPRVEPALDAVDPRHEHRGERE